MEAYQNGEGGYGTLASTFPTVQKRVKIAEKQRGKALQRRGMKQYYLNSSESYLDVALKYSLPSGGLLQSWHQRSFTKRKTFDVQENEINLAQGVHNMESSIRMRKRIRGRLGL
ncbi:hypothetical protein LHM76_002711 [Listeria monocytogenes]|nr:hypothetical protein [Listeria monocytogenes]